MHGARSLASDSPAGGPASPSQEVRRVCASELAAHPPSARRMAHLAAVFSNPTRAKILMLLASHRRLSVTTLAILVGSSVSLVSHNLAMMRTEGWIEMRTLGRIRQVRLASPQRLLAVRHLRDAGRLARQATAPQ